jgi:hypothetical protein
MVNFLQIRERGLRPGEPGMCCVSPPLSLSQFFLHVPTKLVEAEVYKP